MNNKIESTWNWQLTHDDDRMKIYNCGIFSITIFPKYADKNLTWMEDYHGKTIVHNVGSTDIEILKLYAENYKAVR